MRVGVELEFSHGAALNSWKCWCCFEEVFHINYFRAFSAVQYLDFTVLCARPVEGLGEGGAEQKPRPRVRARTRSRADSAYRALIAGGSREGFNHQTAIFVEVQTYTLMSFVGIQV